MLHIFFQRTLASVLLATTIFSGNLVFAQGRFPDKPVKMIIPAPPASGPDSLARLLATKLGDVWNQPVIIENVVGAGGVIGHDKGAKSAPDGYTILMGLIGPMSVSISLIPKMPYDPVKDLAPVTLLGTFANLLVVHPSVPVNNLRELIAYAKQNPGKVRYGHPGSGTSNHLSAEQFNMLSGLKVEGIPYKASSQMTTDLLGGHIEMMFHNAPVVLPYVKSGAMKGIAITSGQRNQSAPEIPTLNESGLPGYEVTSWYAMYAPSGTPLPIIQKLNTDIAKVLALPDVKAWFDTQAAQAGGGSPEALAAFQAAEIIKWRTLIKAADIKAQ
jgi:tripartite-type tricarboxylate transporter receptor subunit TctC